MKHTLPDGHQLYYEVQGNPDAAQTLVFLNGLTQTTTAWAGVAFTLGKKYKQVLVDLLFQGKADAAPEPRSFEAHAADLAHLLQSLQLPDVVLVGISFGGAVAQRVLVNYPELVQAGVLLSTFAQVDAYFEAVCHTWEAALEAGGTALLVDVMLPMVLGRSYFLKPVISIEKLRGSRANQSLLKENVLHQLAAIKESGNYLKELKKVQLPVMLVHGEEDQLCPTEMGKAMNDVLPNAKLETIPKAGHTLNLEAVPALTRLIDAFAASVK
ncbi:alpha/beta fold hydrolase [Pontibacter actiniarum]|uniref:Alpha/beta hydrolase n=1 Tax=Pontibacter actiniarum TaxID=323450 RepID=A0A1X9YVJ8_9BACT|nr:alpha/beta hydrolase [Pontibacter actiniarum]ARS36915.1 alpha/beta hydrolase [Pontibacter actiniarum]